MERNGISFTSERRLSCGIAITIMVNFFLTIYTLFCVSERKIVTFALTK